MFAPWKKSYEKLRQLIKKHRHYFDDKCPYSQNYGFSSSHVWNWELDHKEGWMLKNWSFWPVMLEKTLESPLNCRKIQPVNPKGNQSWIFIRRTDAEAPTLWSPDTKSWLIRKDPDVGKDWGQEEKGVTEDEMVGWHHWFNGHEFEQALGVGEGQGSLVCCSPWGCKESDRTEQLSNNNNRIDWFDLLAVQGTLKSLLQHHSSKASILQHSTFFMVHISYPYMTTGKTIALTI